MIPTRLFQQYNNQRVVAVTHKHNSFEIVCSDLKIHPITYNGLYVHPYLIFGTDNTGAAKQIQQSELPSPKELLNIVELFERNKFVLTKSLFFASFLTNKFSWENCHSAQVTNLQYSPRCKEFIESYITVSDVVAVSRYIINLGE